MTLLVGSGVLMACGTASTSTTTTYSTLSDACAADCARYGAPCNDPAYSDPVYQQANPGLTPVQICTKSCNGTSYQSVSASFDTLAACDSAYLALITCRARLVCGAKWGYACTELCAKEWDAVDQVCACNEPRCGTLVTDACTLKAGHCWPLCPTSSTCSYGVCSSTSACVPACTGSTTCVNGTCHDVCSDCLSSCHGLSGCCTGTGCICESACH